jgi:hypothetical protein
MRSWRSCSASWRRLTSPRAYFNLDWVTLTVMFLITVAGTLYFFIARPDRPVGTHIHDELEPSAAERLADPGPMPAAD